MNAADSLFLLPFIVAGLLIMLLAIAIGVWLYRSGF